MNQSFQKFTLIFMQFSIGKKFKKINSKFGFQKRKPDFGFKTENRISGFRLTSLFRANLFIATNRKDPKDNKTSPLLDDPNGSRQGINVFLPGCLSACVSVCLDSAYNHGCPVPSLNFCLGWDLNPEISRLVALHANY